jgi:hypothetical protein
MTIKHPLEIDVRIRAKVPVCPCTGRSYDEVVANILKVFGPINHKFWYLLSTGQNTNEDNVLAIVDDK